MSTDPRTVVDRYFAAIRANDAAAVTACFAQDAVFESPAGVLRGRAAIEHFYATIAFAFGTVEPNHSTYMVDGSRVAVEVVLRVGDGWSRLADFFHVSDDHIDRLAIYLLPPAR